MPKQKRIIRRLDPAATTALDERLLTANLALIVLLALIGAFAVLTGGFDDPRPLHNAWVRLATLGLTAIVLFFAVNSFCPHRARRLQLCVLISLLLHLLLAVFLYDRHLRMAKKEEPAEPALVLQRDEEVLPEYVEVFDPDQPQPFEEPVEAEIDVAEQSVAPVQRTDPVQQTISSPLSVAESSAPSTTSSQPERQLTSAAPRRSQSMAELSRQTERAQSQASASDVPQATPAESQSVAQLAPTPTNVDRSTASQSRTDTSDAPTTIAAVTEPARSAEQQPRSEPDESPQITRSVEPSRQVASRAESAASVATAPDATSAAASTEVATLLPRNDEPPRRSNEQVVGGENVTEPQPVLVQDTVSPRRNASASAVSQPELARVSDPTRRRTAALIAPHQPPDDVSPNPRPADAVASRTPQESRPISVARSARPDPAMANVTDPDDQSGSSVLASETAQPNRTEDRTRLDPSIEPKQTSPQPRRAVRAADAAASPAPVAQDVAADARQPQRAPLRPARVAMARADAGSLGGESGRNLAVDLPSNAQQSAPQPSAAAERTTATQQQRGPALSPSRSVRIARAVSEADAPAFGAAAVPVQMAEAAGSAEPSQMVASSGATVERRNSAAVEADIVAAQGTAQADLGSEQRVPDVGQRRAGGGGQPTITATAALPRRAVTPSSGSPQSAIDASDVSDVPASPSRGTPASSTLAQSEGTRQSPGRQAAPSDVEATSPSTGAIANSAIGISGPSVLRRREDSQAATGARSGGGVAAPRRAMSPGAVAATSNPLAGLPDAPISDDAGNPRPAPNLRSAVARTGRSSATTGRNSDSPSTAVAEINDDVGGGPIAHQAASRTGRTASAGDPTAAVSASAPTAPGRQRDIASSATGSATAATPTPASSPNDIRTANSGSNATSIAATAGNAPRHSREELAITVNIAEPIDRGGLASLPAATAGSLDRRSRPTSDLVRVTPNRFLRRQTAGTASLGGSHRATAPAFARRTRREEDPARRGAGRPSAKTEEAIELGLVYLASNQRSDGRWSLAQHGVDSRLRPEEKPSLRADTAATGLSLLAFLGAGYDHYQDKYRDVVGNGLQFLIQNQQENGDLYISEDARSNKFNHFYSHGIAAIALCEAYGMTGDRSLKEPAQKALDFIIASQHPEHGGWRYAPGQKAFSSDLSVTGWQVMALKSGELAGLDVQDDVYRRVEEFVQTCQRTRQGKTLFVYNPSAAAGAQNQQQGSKPSTVMTAVGGLMHLYQGKDRTHPILQSAADHLASRLPTYGTSTDVAAIGTLTNPRRDTYYWYYATQVMFHMGGEHWEKWNEALHPLLVRTQSKSGRLAGSWNPRTPVRDQWASQAGRLYVTTMNLLSLQVYYRHLPLYDEAGR